VEIFLIILFVVLAVFVVAVLAKSFRIVPQGHCGIIQRLGKYQRTQMAGLTVMIPFVDEMLPLIDMREQVVSFPPQPVITEDNLVVSIDTVVYFQITDPTAATYGIANYIAAVENLTTTTLRNVVGGMNLEEALTSRDAINTQLRGVLDEATSQWGLRVSRVELKAIDPPRTIQDSMEKQMRAERDRRAAILTAEGQKQSEILTAEGQRQAAILEAEGDAQAAILRANAEAQAIVTVFEAIHEGRPNADLLAYQYLQVLPQIADSESSKMWIIPSEVTDALNRFSGKVADQPSPDSQASSGSQPEGEDQSPTPPPTPRRRAKRPTTAAEIADQAPKAPKLDDTSLEDALAEPEIEEDIYQERPKRRDTGEQN
jgi:regulator of protease activity HflC (stomatin/prohibitin superfamily)